MKTDFAAVKEGLRRQTKSSLASLTAVELAVQSALIADRIATIPEWSCAKSILGYFPTKHEPDIANLLRKAISKGKKIYLPRFDPTQSAYCALRVNDWETELISGKYGVLEPRVGCEVILRDEIDCFLVPGLAFDRTGVRLGRGGGWFDGMLTGIRGLKIGVAFGVQLVSDVPSEPHDVRMDYLVTPEELIPTKSI